MSIATEHEPMFEAGVAKSKVQVPSNSCMPRRAKMRMKRKRRRETMDIRETTRFLREDQYPGRREVKCTKMQAFAFL